MSYTDIAQTAAIIVTIVAFGITQYFSRKSAHADSFIRINGEYNRMVTYRLDHPEVLETAKVWGKGDLDKIGKVKEITRYYSYGELCISFCSVCLYHRKKNLISRDDFENYYSGLINLVATDNTAFFEDVASGKYCPQEFKDWFAQWEKSASLED